MKINLVVHMLALSALMFTSCGDERTSLGKLRKIGLEKTELISDSENSSFTIKTQKTGWDISKTIEVANGKTTVNENSFYIKETGNSKVNIYHETMSGEWYEVSKSSSTEIIVKVSKNTTENDRKLIITITGIGFQEENLTVDQKK